MNSTRAYIVERLMLTLPTSRCYRLKRKLWSWAGAKVGDNVRIISNVKININGRLEVGHDTFIGHEVLMVGGSADILIGANVDIAPRVLIATGSHGINAQGPRVAGDGFSSPVFIGDGAWIGAGATILGGSQIGKLAIVAAGSLVRGTVPDRSIVGGVPAKLIRMIDDEPHLFNSRA